MIIRRRPFGRLSNVSQKRTRAQSAGTRLRIESLEPRALLSADPGWAFALGGPAAADDVETAVGPDGNIYLAGSFSGTVDFDPGPGVASLSAQVGNDAFIAKYTPTGSLMWAQRFGGSGHDYTNALEFDAAGDLTVTGHFSSTTLTIGATTLTNHGNYYVFVARFDDATGNALWARGLGGAAQDTGFDAAVNAAGETYVIGTFQRSVDFDPGAGATILTECGDTGAGDAFVWKLDSSGNLAWARQFGNEMLDNGHSLALDGQGAVYAVGTFRGTVDYGQPGNPLPLTAPKTDAADLFFVKLDEATGATAWARQSTGPAHINAGRLVADGAGSLYFGGGFQQSVTFGSGTPTLVSAGGTDAFLSKWDVDGNLAWAQSLAGAGDTLIQSLQVDAAGNPLATFGFSGSVDFDPGAGAVTLSSSSDMDGAALALNADGSFGWVRQISGPGATQAEGLVQDSARNFYISGSFQTSATLPTGHNLAASGNGTFLMKLAFADPATKFYVVDDGSANRTYEYQAAGTSGDNSGLASANSAPRGAASTAAGDRVWTVDANRNVYVYDINGNLLGSWSAGTMASNATPEGIATNGTDVWIVDGRSDKAYRYTSAASRLSGSQNAASSFSLNSANADPKDIVTDGASLWVVNDSNTDKVFKYNLAGTLQGSWTIDVANKAPTGITLDPANVSHLWIVDSGTDRVYQYNAAATRTSGSQAAALSFVLAAGNTNPQGIADPPAPQSQASANKTTHQATLNGTWLLDARLDDAGAKYADSRAAMRPARRLTLAEPSREFAFASRPDLCDVASSRRAELAIRDLGSADASGELPRKLSAALDAAIASLM